MIFTRLELKNFKSHQDTTIDFNHGISIIVGENGAGKSSIFEAIRFALYKKYDGRKMEDLVRSNKDMGSVTMSVRLNFITRGVEYRVTRIRKNTKSEALLERRDGNSSEYFRMASGDTTVNQEIQGILQMDSELFLNAIYVRQGEIADLVAKTPSERKQLIGKLLKLEELDKAWRNILSIIRGYENRKAELQGKLSSENELVNDLKTKMQEYDHLKEIAAESEDKSKIYAKEKEDNIKAKAAMETEKSSYERLNTNLENEKSNRETLIKDKTKLHEELSEITANVNMMNTLKPYSEKLQLYIDFKESKDKLDKLKEEEKIKNKKLDDIKKFENIIESEKHNYDEYLSLEGIIKDLEEQKSSLESDLKYLNNLKEEKSNLENEHQTSKEHLKKFSLQASSVLKDFDLEDEFSDIKSDEDFDKLKNTVERLRIKTNEEREKNLEKLNKFDSEKISLKEGIKSSKKPLAEIKEVGNQCPICQSEISPQKKDELISEYENTINRNTDRIGEIDSKSEKINEVQEILKNKLEDLEKILKEIYGNRHMAENLKNNAEKISKLEMKLADFEDKKQTLENLSKTIIQETERRKKLETNYNIYLEAQGALKSQEKEYEIKDELYKITGEISREEEKLKELISHDSNLSINISEEELNAHIEEFKLKDQKYNQLVGFTKNKESVENKLDEKNKEIDIKNSQIEEIKKDIKTSKYDAEEYRKLSWLEEKIDDKINRNNLKLGQTKGRLKEIIPAMKSLNEAIERNNKFRAEYDALDNYIALLNDIRTLYDKDGVQKLLRAYSKPLIQKYTKEFFEEFNFNYSNLVLDDEYNITLYGPEGEATLDMVSGGERIAIALALRLGITKAMSNGNIETILLDEPTIHLDNYRRHELIDLLRSMNVLPQMIIVSHDSELENAAETIIKVEKENGISNVKID